MIKLNCKIVFFIGCMILLSFIAFFDLSFLVHYLNKNEGIEFNSQNQNEINRTTPPKYLLYKNNDFGFSFFYPQDAFLVENKDHNQGDYYDIVTVSINERGFNFNATYVPKDKNMDFKDWYALTYQDEIDSSEIKPSEILDFKKYQGYLFEEFNYDHVSENVYVVGDDYVLIFGGYAVPPSFFEEVENQYPIYKEIMNSIQFN